MTYWLSERNASIFCDTNFVSFLLIMTFDLKAQPASISSAICGLRRIIIVFSFFQTNKMEMEITNVVLRRTLESRLTPSTFCSLEI